MIQARRPAGTPVGGQFAPTHRPEAAGIELVEAQDAARMKNTERWVIVESEGGLVQQTSESGDVHVITIDMDEVTEGDLGMGSDDVIRSWHKELGRVVGDPTTPEGVRKHADDLRLAIVRRLHDRRHEDEGWEDLALELEAGEVDPAPEAAVCDECGSLVEDEVISDQHETWCSLHRDNVVEAQGADVPDCDDPRIESSGELPVHLQAHLLRTGNAAADIATEAADKLDRQHEALRGIQALLSDPQWDSPADRLEQIAMLIEGAGYAHEDYRPEVGEPIELQLEDRTVLGRIEWTGGDETLIVPNAGTRPVRLPTAAIEWDRDNQTWFHAPDDEGTG